LDGSDLSMTCTVIIQ